MNNEATIKTLVLYANYTDKISYYDDWLDSLTTGNHFDCSAIDITKPRRLQLLRAARSSFDLIILLHSSNADTLEYLHPLKGFLNDRNCPLLSFVGNELNLPFSPLKRKIEFLQLVNVDAIASQLPLAAAQWLYEDCPSATVFEVPHALNPRFFYANDNERDIDIGVRSAKYAAYLGDNERNELFLAVETTGRDRGLRLDLSTSERLTRSSWAAFLRRCIGTVSNEAGTYYLERDDKTVQAARAQVLENIEDARFVIRADSIIHRLRKYVPRAIKSFIVERLKTGTIRHEAFVEPDLDFESIYSAHFSPLPRAPIHTKCISSRHFEAAGTKTCQILLDGEYNGILTRDVHYIGVSPDLGDLDQAFDRFLDVRFRKEITDNAYNEIMSRHTFGHRIDYLSERVASLL